MQSFQRFELAIPAHPVRSVWPSISACMIVRNEEPNLRPCLESLGDLASEIIVVDTGSMDNTVQIAREMGAKVFHFTWIDDFAAARNESLRHATKEWIFWLDADDRLDAKAVAQLKNAVASGRADAYMCLVSSRELGGERTVTEHTRLFRNHLGVRFAGAIHENVFSSVADLGLRLGYGDIAIEHTGYESGGDAKAKALRNLAIIDKQLEQRPGNVDLLFYRGLARRSLENTMGAAADLREYLAHTAPDSQFDHMRFWAYSVLVPILFELNDTEAGDALLRLALHEFPDHPRFLFIGGTRQLMLGRPKQGLESLLGAMSALDSTVKGLRPAEWAVESRIAYAYRELGDREEAIRHAERAIALAPDFVEAQRLLVRLAIETEKYIKAVSMAAARAAAGRGMGRVDNARAARKQMEGLASLSTGENGAAARCFALAIDAEPTSQDNYKYLAVALQRLGQQEQALEVWKIGTQLASTGNVAEAQARVVFEP